MHAHCAFARIGAFQPTASEQRPISLQAFLRSAPGPGACRRSPPSTRTAASIRLLAALLSSGALACALTGEPPPQTVPAATNADAERAPSRPPTPIRSPRQLTFAGRRSGEGYFSRDGSHLVFQSEREAGNPFYQIYELDLSNGETRRLSPGVGKTTCAYFHPGGRTLLFSSTHHDPSAAKKQQAEIELRESGKQRRYAWDYDAYYEIYAIDREDPEAPPERLTRHFGYDAEASYSPSGQQIVFASNRHVFASADDGAELLVDRGHFERDPAAFVDLYVMDRSGRAPRRLTTGVGYDGGPFFSPDGQRIVWRSFAPDGATAEIHSMKTDGTDVRRLTNLGAMSWAPFYHPSGDYVVFATNLHGMENFELYIVDALGEGTPVRVTEREGFDGLPVFSPSGDELVWTSNRTANRTSQLFAAEWDDAAARRALGLPAIRTGAVAPLLPLPSRTAPAIETGDLRAHLAALASDTTEGRLTGSPGERIATSYVARAFRRFGLLPDGDQGSYFQSFGFTGGVSLGPDNRLELEQVAAPPPTVDVDWRPFAFSREGEIPAAEVVFVGYGIVAPAAEGQRAVDDYADVDVEGKWAMALRFIPEELSAESRQHLHRFSSLRYKAMVARDRGALGLIIVTGPRATVRDQLAPLRFDVSLAGTSIAAISISDALADRMLASSGVTLAELHDAADGDSASPGLALQDLRLAAKIDLAKQRGQGRNVLGRIQVGERPSEDVVMVGAHVDHLGRGEGASSLAQEDARGQIHAGADDNASGVAALLEIAEWLAEEQRSGRLRARRDIVLAAWSGEEMGLLGSHHFVSERLPTSDDPHVPAPPGPVVAYLNMDMIGRLEDHLVLLGTGSSSEWMASIERHNVPIGLPIVTKDDSYLPTDATSFYARGVPILSAFTGAHSEYHTPRDTTELIDFDGLQKTARLIGSITRTLARAEGRPDYVAMARPRSRSGAATMRVYLGTIPDYAQTEVSGVLLSDVAMNGPAQRAGIRGGDVIVEVAGRKVENIYDYTYALDALKVGEAVSIAVRRDGEIIELEITPE